MKAMSYLTKSVGPAGNARFGYNRFCTFVLLNEFAIEVPTIALTSLAEFALHPKGIGELMFQSFLDQ